MLKLLSQLILPLLLVCAASGANTTIQDNSVYQTGSSVKFSGTISVRLNTPMTIGSVTYGTASQSFTVTGGNFKASFAPNDQGSPVGTTYTATFVSTTGASWAETWSIPTSGSPLTISAVIVPFTATPEYFIPLKQLWPYSATDGQFLQFSQSLFTWQPVTLSYEAPLTFNSPFSRSGNTISMAAASGSQNGYLLSTDWATFNAKQNALGYTPENVANKGVANGYAPLNASTLLSAAFLPPPTTSSLGAVQAVNSASHQWVSYIDSSGVPHQSQPSASDVSGLAASATTDTTNASNITSGTLPAGRLPTPTNSSLGGIFSIGSLAHSWVTYIDNTGLVHQAQPSCGDLSGVAASCSTDTTNASNISSGTLPAGRLPTPTTGALGGVKASTPVTHQFLTSVNTDGSESQSQPACGDLSNAAASCSTDTTNAGNISSGTLPAGRLPNPSATTLGGVESITQTTHQWVDSISTAGVPHQSQPAGTDITFTQTGTGATATTLGARSNDLVNARTDFGADNTGATDASTALVNALSAVITSGKKNLYIPAGTYSVTKSTGTLLSLTSGANGVCVFGDGAGVTILQFANNVALSANTNVFQISGQNQCIHDLSIYNGTGMSGSANWVGIAIGQGSYTGHVYNIEISGIYGGSTAGGGGITTYQPWNQGGLVNTTMGGSYSSGSQTVTPSSMVWIYKGQRLLIGGSNAEAVIVTATTATTFTATFANSHISTDSITSNSQAYQGAVIENCYIHDSYQATAIVLNSSSNVVQNCRIINIGSNSTQHGIYDQGGTNRISHNYIEGISGVGIHGHKAVPEEDSSGAVYDGNVVINYGTYCILTDTLISDGVNPEVPSTSQYLNRYALIENNQCRQRIGVGGSGVVAAIQTSNPAIITGNMLEDACGNTGSCLFISAASGSVPNATCVVSHNLVSILNATNASQIGVGLNSPYCVSDHNTLQGWIASKGIYLNNTQTASHGDTVYGAQSGTNSCVAVNASYTEVSGLRCTANSTGYGPSQAGLVGERLHDSVFNMATSTTNAINLNATFSGVFSDIQISQGQMGINCSYGGSNLTVRNIDGTFLQCGNNNGIAASPVMGRFVAFPISDTTAVTQNRGVCLDSSESVETCTTSQTTFIGYAVSTKGTNVSTGMYYAAGQVGTEVPAWATDGAWTAGHYGILSTTTGGELHDNGTSPPSSGSYVQFLNTGASAGNADVLVLKTQ